MNEEIILTREEIRYINRAKKFEKWLNMTILQKMTLKNIKNPNWCQIIDHSYKILVIGGSRSGKANALLDLIKQQNDDDYIIINKIYLYLKGPNEAKNH